MVLAATLTVVATAASAKTTASPATDVKIDTITGVDLQNLTFKIIGKDGKETMYNVTALTEIVVNGKSAKIEDLKKGMTAKVTSSDSKNAERIDAQGKGDPIKPATKKRK